MAVTLLGNQEIRNSNFNILVNIACGRCHAVASRRNGYVAKLETREYFLCHCCLSFLEMQVARDWLRVAGAA